jgi:hypothetical protein
LEEKSCERLDDYRTVGLMIIITTWGGPYQIQKADQLRHSPQSDKRTRSFQWNVLMLPIDAGSSSSSLCIQMYGLLYLLLIIIMTRL